MNTVFNKIFIRIIANDRLIAAKIGSNIYGLNISEPGLNITNTPIKPTIIADQRFKPTVSFKKNIAIIVVIIILEKATAETSAKGNN